MLGLYSALPFHAAAVSLIRRLCFFFIKIAECLLTLYDCYLFIAGRETGVSADILPSSAKERAVDCHVKAIEDAVFKRQRSDPPRPTDDVEKSQPDQDYSHRTDPSEKRETD